MRNEPSDFENIKDGVIAALQELLQFSEDGRVKIEVTSALHAYALLWHDTWAGTSHTQEKTFHAYSAADAVLQWHVYMGTRGFTLPDLRNRGNMPQLLSLTPE